MHLHCGPTQWCLSETAACIFCIWYRQVRCETDNTKTESTGTKKNVNDTIKNPAEQSDTYGHLLRILESK